jgi:beta-N-acetylhexosaminidase
VRLKPWLWIVLAVGVAVAGALTLATERAVTTHRRVSGVTTSRSSLVRGLSLKQLAGQRIIYAYSGLEPPAELLDRVRSSEAAGVILFAPNIASRKQLRAVIRRLQAAAAASKVHAPLLIMTDQEGGLVRRVPGAPRLSEKQIGEGPRARWLAAAAGTGAARTLSGLGVNVNLAPVLDVFRRTGDFIDRFQRSYGKSPRLVAELSETFVSSQQLAGVAATAKHFPGLGAAQASQNTDATAVRLDVSSHELHAVDEYPYRAAISAGVRLVMMAWATYPALDARSPAGLSSIVINGELRRRLGFHGVTITDGISVGALARFGTYARRGALAALAGEDLLLCSARNVNENSPTEGIAVLRGIAAALAAGTIRREDAEEAAARVLALRANPS